MDITKLSKGELQAYIERLDQVKHAPAARRAVAKREASAIKQGKTHETVDQTLSHLF